MEGRITPSRSVSLAAAGLAATAVLAAFCSPLRAQSSAPAAPAPQALVSKYCVACHSQKARIAGVVLEGIDFSHPSEHAAILERALRKVRTGEMPPPGMPHPDDAARQQFTNW